MCQTPEKFSALKFVTVVGSSEHQAAAVLIKEAVRTVDTAFFISKKNNYKLK